MTADLSGMGMAEGFNANIGNYKGVMLCNRPADPVNMHSNDRYPLLSIIRQGAAPFISRVENHEQLGLNPAKKENKYPKRTGNGALKGVVKQKEALVRHKKFIAELEAQKKIERRMKEEDEMLKRDKTVLHKSDG